jgi:hypothetical protein
MYARILVALAMSAVAFPAGAPENIRYEPAPSDDVVFEVPINLTQLASDITKVDVTCTLTSDAITEAGPRGSSRQLAGHVVLDVSNGQVVKPATTVVVAVPADRVQDPAKHPFNWECRLTGYSIGSRPPPPARRYPAGWDTFAERHDKASFVMSPAPPVLSGEFNW